MPSWLDQAKDDPEGKNRARHLSERLTAAAEARTAGQQTIEEIRIQAEKSLRVEMNERAREAARDKIPPPFRGRDILSSGLTNATLGLAALAAVAIAEPKSHDAIRAGFETIGNTVTEIKHDLTSVGQAFKGDIFAPAFDNE